MASDVGRKFDNLGLGDVCDAHHMPQGNDDDDRGHHSNDSMADALATLADAVSAAVAKAPPSSKADASEKAWRHYGGALFGSEKATRLSYGSLSWGDAEAATFCQVIGSGDVAMASTSFLFRFLRLS